MEFRDPSTGQIKTWVWIVSGLGIVVLLFLAKSVAGGQTTSTGTTPAGGQNSDITDLLNQLNDALTNIKQPPTQDGGPDPTPKPKHELVDYTVVKGDTWKSIATKYGMTLRQFFRVNPTLKNIDTPTTVRSGGRIIQVWKPAAGSNPGPTSYTVKHGDTWKSITSHFGITLAQFYALNPSIRHTPNQIRQGGKVVVVGTSNTH
jgi:LysM repeat protein